MRTLRRYLASQIAAASGLVLLAFLGLVFFLDVVNDLSNNGGPGTLPGIMSMVALQIPERAYEILPIAVLTGTVYVLASLAASSEFTVMRMSGLSPRLALGQLLALGLAFSCLVLALGEFAVPAASQLSATLQARQRGGEFGSRPSAGIWVRDRGSGGSDEMINIGSVTADGDLRNIHIYVLDSTAELVRVVDAGGARYAGAGDWLLHDVSMVALPPAASPQPLRITRAPTLPWQTSVSPAVLSALLLDPDTMSGLDLWRYLEHQRANGQDVRRGEIALWRKLLYPLSALVMMMLALPFAYLHARSGQVSWKVFGGIMLGISFILVNTLASSVGLLASWPTWMTAALPYLLYGGGSLGYFLWRVRYR